MNMNEPVEPGDAAGSRAEQTQPPAAALPKVGSKPDEEAGNKRERGSSTYATGGGGVSFAHRVATVYLASMLTRGRRAEASELPAQRVSFQTSPTHPVDDLLVECGDGAAEVTLAIACRATPDFVPSNEATTKLVGSLLAEVEKFDVDTHQVAVAVSGWSAQWEQLATVCAIARVHDGPESFQGSMDVDRRWSKQVRDRLGQFRKIVENLVEDGTPPEKVLQLAWRLLGRLHILGFAVQAPDASDRTAVANSLDGIAEAQVDGVEVRDRLEVEATRYDATGAVVDLNLLRRDLHIVLNPAETRSRHAWTVLAEHRKLAVASVRTTIGNESSGESVKIAFSEQRKRIAGDLLETGASASTLLVAGESGVGKSALTLSAVADLEAADPAGFEAVVVNFRSLPQSSVELQSSLGTSVKNVLSELSAPSRILVVDAADAVLERSGGLLGDLVFAAAAAGVGVVAVTSDVASAFVQEQLELGFGKPGHSFAMKPLTDQDISVVADHFPLLRAVLRELPANSLLRRPIVLDLLARTGLEPDRSLGEWECLELVWKRVVRGDGRPDVGSAEAREQTLLAVAASTMQLPADRRPSADINPAAVDALRRDHLLAPASPYQERPVFAHDEVRRFATALLLVRSGTLTEILEAARAPRWALSAATLACKGLMKAPHARPARLFVELITQFTPFANTHGPRWIDVPVEAVLDTPFAYQCVKAAVDNQSVGLTLGDVVRVVQQRHKVGALVNTEVAASIVQVLLDADEPWDVSNESFELLTDWLQALSLADKPAGNELRIRLRSRLLAYWESFPPRDNSNEIQSDWMPGRRRRHLDYHLTGAEFVETLALLGPDIDAAAEACLRAIARDAPAFLAPAADSPLSSRALAQKDPELLAALMEAYYIEDEHSWHRDNGIRRHQGRWKGFGPPYSQYYFGGFWHLFQTAPLRTSARVLNNILNSAARAQAERAALRDSPEFSSYPVTELDEDPVPEADSSEQERGSLGIVMNLDGSARLYTGHSHMWSLYRGTSIQLDSATSALLAMELVADLLLNQGASLRKVAEVLLDGCQNLAVPGMLFGLMVRHMENAGTELDAFLAEPAVWKLEFGRHSSERSMMHAETEGLANLERRLWTPYDVALQLLLQRGEARAGELKKVAEKLVRNGERLGISQERTTTWAASLDPDRYRVERRGDKLHVEVVLPSALQTAREPYEAYQKAVHTTLRLQNRYWGSAKHDVDYVPPSAEEIAADLVAGRSLLASDEDLLPTRPVDAVAHVVRTAVERAASGDLDALGNESGFATDFVLRTALSHQKADDERHEEQYFDLRADRAVAQALPAFLTPAMTAPLTATGRSTDQVATAGFAIAGKASRETRLYLARGCDVVWTAPCHGEPCIHRIALNWLVETARTAEIGPRDQRPSNVEIVGGVSERLQKLPGDAVDIAVLDAAVRGLGAAAVSDHCCTDDSTILLATLLRVERRAMTAQDAEGWEADDRGTHSLVAARALLEGFARNGDVGPVLDHVDALRAHAHLMTNFLHGLAAAGAENERRAAAARGIWPSLLRHAIDYLGGTPNPYQDKHWGDWSAAALLPDPMPWTQGLYNENAGAPINWVRAEDFVEHIDGWLPAGQGAVKCVDALIGIMKKLPTSVQVTRGLSWVSALCMQNGRVTVKQSWLSNDWLKGIRSKAEELDRLAEWQMLVDSMVVAGNEGLAPYSR